MSKKSNLFLPEVRQRAVRMVLEYRGLHDRAGDGDRRRHDGLDLNGVPLTSLQIDAPRLDHSAQSVAFPFSRFKQKLRRTPDHAVTLAGQGLLYGLGL